MTAQEFNDYQKRLSPSRRQFCLMIGIGKRSGDAYAHGDAPVPKTVALAIAAIEAGLDPAGDENCARTA